MMTTNDTPKIYVACLASYNAGKLHGAWIDVDEWLDEDDLQVEIDKMLEASPVDDAEEWAIHDYDGFPSCMGEHSNLESIVAAAAIMHEHGEVGRKVIEHHCGNIDYAEETLRDRSVGVYESLADCAREYHENACGPELPDYIRNNIDWESAGEELTQDCIVLELSAVRIAVLS